MDGERFNERLCVDLRDVVDVRGNRYWWLVAVDQHTDHTQIAPCPSHESQAVAKKIFKHWTPWAGPPDVLVCDGERSLGASEIFTENLCVKDPGANHSSIFSVAEGSSRAKDRNHEGNVGQNDFATPSGGEERHVSCQPRGCQNAEPKSWEGWAFSTATRVFGQRMKVYGELMEHGEVVPHPKVLDEGEARETLEEHAASKATEEQLPHVPRQ